MRSIVSAMMYLWQNRSVYNKYINKELSVGDIDSNPKPNSKININLDLRWVVLTLLAVIAVMVVIWQPWNSLKPNDRTVSVSGVATLKAEPDEYVFYPSYEFKNADKSAAIKALTAKSNEIVAGLKNQGVNDKDIKTNSNGYDTQSYYPEKDNDGSTYSLSLTVTVANRELAQKVEDYLVTTSPSGQVSPQATFSDTKRKELEDRAREEASKDARSKAEKSAKSLGFKLGKVKSVDDGAGFGGPILLEGRAGGISAEDVNDKTFLIQPGENDFSYTVTVVYFVQ